MWPSVRCIKLRIGIYLLQTNFLSIERRRRRSRICKHEQRAIRSSKNQIDRIRREIPLSLTTPSLTILLKNCQSRRGKTVLEGPENWHVIGYFFPILLATATTQFSPRKKRNRSDSSESYSVQLMTPLMILFFSFHSLESVLTTLTTTPTLTPSPVKTCLQ